MLTLLRLAGATLLLTALLATGRSSPVAAAPTNQPAACVFAGGFQLLHDLIPAIVGACTENEHFNAANGNAEQRTTGGLLVWRKADNWTAFTDGGTTWINGPAGVQSRANGDHFPWEPASDEPQAGQPIAPASPNLGLPPLYTDPTSGAPPSPPTAPSTTTAAPPTQTADTPSSDAAPGPLSLKPEDALLRLDDMGKEISQKNRRTGSDNRSAWAEIRFERPEKYVDAKFGPYRIDNRVYIAKSVADAAAIYRDEVGKQSQMPEADKADLLGGTFRLEGIKNVGDEQDSLSACSPDCNSDKRVMPQHRTVFRYQNAVVLLYFIGARDSAQPDADQANEWLTKLRERLG